MSLPNEWDEFKAEFVNEFRWMTPEFRKWAREALAELSAEIKATELLLQVFPNAEPINLKTWRPSTPPPSMSWAEYEAYYQRRLADLEEGD